MASIFSRNSRLCVFTSFNSSCMNDRLICLFMNLLYHFFHDFSRPLVLCGVALVFDMFTQSGWQGRENAIPGSAKTDCQTEYAVRAGELGSGWQALPGSLTSCALCGRERAESIIFAIVSHHRFALLWLCGVALILYSEKTPRERERTIRRLIWMSWEKLRYFLTRLKPVVGAKRRWCSALLWILKYCLISCSLAISKCCCRGVALFALNAEILYLVLKNRNIYGIMVLRE